MARCNGSRAVDVRPRVLRPQRSLVSVLHRRRLHTDASMRPTAGAQTLRRGSTSFSRTQRWRPNFAGAGLPPARHLARAPASVIIRRAGQAPSRRQPSAQTLGLAVTRWSRSGSRRPRSAAGERCLASFHWPSRPASSQSVGGMPAPRYLRPGCLVAVAVTPALVRATTPPRTASTVSATRNQRLHAHLASGRRRLVALGQERGVGSPSAGLLHLAGRLTSLERTCHRQAASWPAWRSPSSATRQESPSWRLPLSSTLDGASTT